MTFRLIKSTISQRNAYQFGLCAGGNYARRDPRSMTASEFLAVFNDADKRAASDGFADGMRNATVDSFDRIKRTVFLAKLAAHNGEGSAI